ncbi:hypothetical protein NKR23_g12395 [Pleurostoma richardsiae]|uniref:Uncharacterized protein n=1 Tax=Pleurostoma richardsiae TaxID=41990 RepID=A0AA38VAX0_9PEZI|nr:hypothetical protein NKR23_g12395 [Pleurostoma richardsiae]
MADQKDVKETSGDLKPTVADRPTDRPTSFLSLPSEIRNGIYNFILLYQEPINPWSHKNLTLGLLRANMVIHDEAGSLFYGQNHFDFTDATAEEIGSFLQQIGSNNAGQIQHILIDFPEFLYLDPGDVILKEGSVDILANIWNGCANVSTLTTSLWSTNAMEVRLDNLEHHRIAFEALELVDTHFRAISSVREIILEVYQDGPSDHIRGLMRSRGWTINTTEYVEEEDSRRSFSDFDDDDDDYGYDDADYDDYDIDNDSDFWRRAAD